MNPPIDMHRDKLRNQLNMFRGLTLSIQCKHTSFKNTNWGFELNFKFITTKRTQGKVRRVMALTNSEFKDNKK